jgi:hypothetical protein
MVKFPVDSNIEFDDIVRTVNDPKIFEYKVEHVYHQEFLKELTEKWLHEHYIEKMKEKLKKWSDM